jgi:uncharacterized membrane protein
MGEGLMQYFWMFGAGVVAYMHGRGMLRWMLAAYVFGWFAVIILLLLPKKMEKIAQREQTFRAFAEDHVIKQEFKDVNTVDDLMKQL